MEYKICRADELYHYGVLGMKWGRRRYQNRDGTLTAAGKKRLEKESAALKKEEEIVKNRKAVKSKLDKMAIRRQRLDEAKKALEEDITTAKKKTPQEMTMEELRTAVNRAQLEKQYADLTAPKVDSQKTTAGKKFINGMLNDVVAPVAKNVGKSWLEGALKKAVGLDKSDDGFDMDEAMKIFNDTTKEERTQIKEAAQMFENIDKIRKKGTTKD